MTLPKFKFQTLKEAREEMAKFGLTTKVCTLSQAKNLLRAKRAELSTQAKQGPEDPASAVAKISKPPITPLPTAKVSPVAKPVVFDVQNYLAVRVKQLSGVWMSKSELSVLCVANDATAVLESAISTLSKTTQYHSGVLLSNAHTTLQKNELTKGLDPRDLLSDIQTAKAIKLESERDKAYFATWR
jgi:hypothetical protein